MHASSFEIKDGGVAQDMLSGVGFCYAVSLALRLWGAAP